MPTSRPRFSLFFFPDWFFRDALYLYGRSISANSKIHPRTFSICSNPVFFPTKLIYSYSTYTKFTEPILVCFTERGKNMEFKRLTTVGMFIIGAVLVMTDIGCDFALFWVYIHQAQAYAQFCDCGSNCILEKSVCGPDARKEGWPVYDLFQIQQYQYQNITPWKSWEDCCWNHGNFLEIFHRKLFYLSLVS